jgi:hypothetical protein
VDCIGLGSGQEQVRSPCEFGIEPAGSIKMLGNYRLFYQLEASRVVFSSIESASRTKTQLGSILGMFCT